jgi:hypothetical protein
VEHIVHPRDRALRERFLGEIPLEELDAGHVIEVAAFACNETIRDPNGMTTPYEFFGKMRADEAGAAGHEIISHAAWT